MSELESDKSSLNIDKDVNYEKELEEKNIAALKIQKNWRKHRKKN